jgi:tetratricopeptide (TPR) repeat protein
VAWGLTGWAAGSLYYDTGYYDYANPYYDASTAAEYPAINYSQPIDTTTALPESDSSAATAAVSDSDQARNAFYSGDYARALSSLDAALGKTPSDAVLHEFRALCLFAMHRYKEAAGTLYAVLSVGPGWDWTTMSGLYPNVDVYTEQLRALEDDIRRNPDSPDARFVLAYHYMTAGHQDAAGHQLKEVIRLAPKDQLSRQLLTMVSPSESSPPETTATVPSTTEPEPKRTAPGDIVGNWNASAKGGGTVELSLSKDNRFTWKLTRPNKSQAFDGKYELAGTTLVLEYSNGGSMVGRVNAEGTDKFSFKMVGGPPNDPGLTFSK